MKMRRIILSLLLLACTSSLSAREPQVRAVGAGTIIAVVLGRDGAAIASDSLELGLLDGGSSLAEKVIPLGERIYLLQAGVSKIVYFYDGRLVDLDVKQVGVATFSQLTAGNPSISIRELATELRHRLMGAYNQAVSAVWPQLKPHFETRHPFSGGYVGIDQDGKVRMSIFLIDFERDERNRPNPRRLKSDFFYTIAVNDEAPEDTVYAYVLGKVKLLQEIKDSNGAARPDLRNRPGIIALVDKVAADRIAAAEDLVSIVLENAENVCPPIHSYEVTESGIRKVRSFTPSLLPSDAPAGTHKCRQVSGR